MSDNDTQSEDSSPEVILQEITINSRKRARKTKFAEYEAANQLIGNNLALGLTSTSNNSENEGMEDDTVISARRLANRLQQQR